MSENESIAIKEELQSEVSNVELTAMNVNVTSDADYVSAGELTKEIKRMQKKVEEYWKPIYENAYSAYKAVNEHKKEMLDPLKKAEGILKQKLSEYSMKKQREQREKEEALRKLAIQEMEKKLAEAAEAEKRGDTESAEYAMAEAEVYESASAIAMAPAAKPKADGISTSKSWEIVSIDERLVPVTLNGVVLRKVDESAIKRLIKLTKGQIVIPGVTFKETESISVRTA